MISNRVGKRAEDDPRLGELLLEGRRHRYAVEYRVDGDPREARAFVQRYAQLGIGGEQLRIDLLDALRRIERRARRGIIGNVLIVDGLVVHPRPSRLLHGLPVPKRFQTPVEQELRLLFLQRYRAHHVLVESGRQAEEKGAAVPARLASESVSAL